MLVTVLPRVIDIVIMNYWTIMTAIIVTTTTIGAVTIMTVIVVMSTVPRYGRRVDIYRLVMTPIRERIMRSVRFRHRPRVLPLIVVVVVTTWLTVMAITLIIVSPPTRPLAVVGWSGMVSIRRPRITCRCRRRTHGRGRMLMTGRRRV